MKHSKDGIHVARFNICLLHIGFTFLHEGSSLDVYILLKEISANSIKYNSVFQYDTLLNYTDICVVVRHKADNFNKVKNLCSKEVGEKMKVSAYNISVFLYFVVMV
jgi:hypothetical protein